MAVRDQWIPTVASKGGVSNYQELGLAEDASYFNSGVLVFNLKKWRRRRLTTKCFGYLSAHEEEIDFADQGLLNAVLSKQWSELSPSWNIHHQLGTDAWYEEASLWSDSPYKEYLLSQNEELLSDADILHFAGPEKPWILGNYHPQALQWFALLWTSGWLSIAETLESILKFFVHRYTQSLRYTTRPVRHWLAGKCPASLRRILSPYAD